MRLAIVISPWDPRSSEGGGEGSDVVAWLGASLARLGFDMAVVGGTDAVGAELARLLEGMTAEDSVLVHVSGTLARRGVLRLVDGRWLPLRAIGDALAAHAPGDVSVLAELVHEDDAEDALVAADHVASAVSAIGARERGYAMIAAVRPSGTNVEAIAFTRVLLDAAAAAAERRDDAQLSAVYQAVRAMPESVGLAQSFTLVRGRVELELAPPAPPPADLGSLIDAATEAGDWARAVKLRRERLETMGSPRQRVKELVAIARIQQQHLAEPDAALAALEEARTLEPRRASVLQALSRGYEMVGRWASAIEVTGALAEVTPMPTDRAALRYAQARMALDHLQDEERALALLEQTLEEDPSHTEARAALGHLRSSLTPPEPMPVPQEVSVSTAPPQQDDDELDPAVHLRAFGQRRREGRADAAFLSALALEELGASYPDLQTFIDQTRSVTPIRARGTIDAAAWELLRPYGMDEVLTALFGAVSRAGAKARVEQLAARGRLVALDPASRLDDASTASVVRSFQWAARVLGARCPDLYVVPEVPGEIAAVRAPEPSTAVGPSIVSGRSAKDLAFLAGRHLTYYRPEAQVLVYFPTRDELTRLLLAAVRLSKREVMEEEPQDDANRAVAALATRLDRHISDDDRNDLRRAVWELEVRGGKFSLGAFTRNVELMAARAGLLLCGDLATATAIVSTESRAIAGLSLEAKRRDLVAFNVSEEHITLRERFAHGSAESVRPPAAPPGSAAAYTR